MMNSARVALFTFREVQFKFVFSHQKQLTLLYSFSKSQTIVWRINNIINQIIPRDNNAILLYNESILFFDIFVTSLNVTAFRLTSFGFSIFATATDSCISFSRYFASAANFRSFTQSVVLNEISARHWGIRYNSINIKIQRAWRKCNESE